jgi:hypothetical protein
MIIIIEMIGIIMIVWPVIIKSVIAVPQIIPVKTPWSSVPTVPESEINQNRVVPVAIVGAISPIIPVVPERIIPSVIIIYS